MHNQYPQMGCSDGAMGYYHKGLGTVIYDEPGQMNGGQMGDALSNLFDVVKNQIPGLTQNVFGNWLATTKEGQTFQNQAEALGAQAAASQMAAQDATFRQNLQSFYNSQLSSLKQNYKTYLMYAAVAAVVVGAVIYFGPAIKRSLMGSTRAVATNPRRKRNSSRRRSRKSRRR